MDRGKNIHHREAYRLERRPAVFQTLSAQDLSNHQMERLIKLRMLDHQRSPFFHQHLNLAVDSVDALFNIIVLLLQ